MRARCSPIERRAVRCVAQLGVVGGTTFNRATHRLVGRNGVLGLFSRAIAELPPEHRGHVIVMAKAGLRNADASNVPLERY